MERSWNDHQPIYRQLRDRVAAMILDRTLSEGELLPSVRQVATDYRINPLTVMRAYQELSDEGLVDKRRGIGMYVTRGAAALLLQRERDSFLKEQWPEILKTIRRLGLSVRDLPDDGENG